jgi:hypothetical protein
VTSALAIGRDHAHGNAGDDIRDVAELRVPAGSGDPRGFVVVALGEQRPGGVPVQAPSGTSTSTAASTGRRWSARAASSSATGPASSRRRRATNASASSRAQRRRVGPVRVVDQAQQRPLPGDRRQQRQQRQRRQRHQQPVRHRPRSLPEDHPSARAGGCGSRPVQPSTGSSSAAAADAAWRGRGRVTLRLDAHRGQQAHPGRLLGGAAQQRAVADARLAAQHQAPPRPARARSSSAWTAAPPWPARTARRKAPRVRRQDRRFRWCERRRPRLASRQDRPAVAGLGGGGDERPTATTTSFPAQAHRPPHRPPHPRTPRRPPGARNGHDPTQLAGRVAVVTGASRGIGAATAGARRRAAAVAAVVAAARNQQALAALAEWS